MGVMDVIFQSESDGDTRIMCEDEAGRPGDPQARKDTLLHDEEQTLVRTPRCLALAPTPPSRTYGRPPRIADSHTGSLKLLLTWMGGT
ncbi:hypothetical protein FIBSPDRAFT_846482 [Athelia psychrophila]|uniref:Uncharacterized protein n=1 Tax=Athelia psychrophila TaxID=1759441 RepID=A0A166X310_9AGAM|nr:hypothetical protein FIBSPDRAFT_846482 [Fibularhizoctonia sp. CBS 109695]